MHARLIRFTHLPEETFEPTVAWIGEEVLPVLAGLPGYTSIFLGINPKHGNGVAITFWENERALKRSDATEAPLRKEALARARGEQRYALTDSYEVAINIAGTGTGVPEWARLSRWSGMTSVRTREGHDRYRERMPALQELPGFSGTFSGTDFVNGKVLTLFLWESGDAMAGSFDWERSASEEIRKLTGPSRPIIAETYQVAVAPELG